MTRPLQPGDPDSFGPFVVDSRLADSPAGVVFLGSDEEGRRAAIAALIGPAAEDPTMQDRFREVADPAELYSTGGGVRVLAADLDGSRPWIATPYDGVRPGAERVFEELSSDDATARYFQPFTQYPALTGYEPQTRKAPAGPQRAWWWWLVVGTVLFAILLVLLLIFSRCGLGGPGPGPSGSSGSGSATATTTRTQTQSGSNSGSQSNSQSQPNSPSQSGSQSPSGSNSGTTPGGTNSGEPTGAPLQLPKRTHPPSPSR